VNARGIVATDSSRSAEADRRTGQTENVLRHCRRTIEVVGKAFLGLTIACARCHDHKFDPISTKDYYSMASIFASTKQLSKLEGTVSQLYFAPLVECTERGGVGCAHEEDRSQAKRSMPLWHPSKLGIASSSRHTGQIHGGHPRRTWTRGWSSSGPNISSRPGKRRPHLEEWEQSAPNEREAVAQRYQQRYEATRKPGPAGGKFLAGDDRSSARSQAPRAIQDAREGTRIAVSGKSRSKLPNCGRSLTL
jgi:hypothetical protein